VLDKRGNGTPDADRVTYRERVASAAPSSSWIPAVRRARMALESAGSVSEVKQVRDKAEALRLYVKQAGHGLALQNEFAELKLRAERQAGKMLARTLSGAGQRFHAATFGSLQAAVASLASRRLDTGRDFDVYIAESHHNGRELTRRVRSSFPSNLPLLTGPRPVFPSCMTTGPTLRHHSSLSSRPSSSTRPGNTPTSPPVARPRTTTPHCRWHNSRGGTGTGRQRRGILRLRRVTCEGRR